MKKLALVIGILICLPAGLVYSLQDDREQTIPISTAMWDSAITQQKVEIIAGIIDIFKEFGTVIQKEPEFYVKEIERIRFENPEEHVKPIHIVFRTMAILYKDFANGEDADALIKQILGQEKYEAFVLNLESKKREDSYNEWKKTEEE